MAAPTRTSRIDWVTAGLAALAEGGPEAVKVDVIARSLGVSRGGFYGTFKNRDAFLAALLEAWEHAAIDEVLDRVEAGGGDPRERAIRAGLLSFSDELAPVDLAVREWARRDPAVARRLERVDRRRLDYLRIQFSAIYRDPDRVEGACLLAFSLAISIHYIPASGGDRPPPAAIQSAIEMLFPPP